MNANPQEQLSLSSAIRHRAVDNEGVLVHLENGRVIIVNEVGLHIIKQLTSPQTREALTESISSHFRIGTDSAAGDLDRFIAELDKEHVLQRHHVQD